MTNKPKTAAESALIEHMCSDPPPNPRDLGTWEGKRNALIEAVRAERAEPGLETEFEQAQEWFCNLNDDDVLDLYRAQRAEPEEAENVCEHGDHPAPIGQRFCSLVCQLCEFDSTGENGCDGICCPPDGPEPLGEALPDWSVIDNAIALLDAGDPEAARGVLSRHRAERDQLKAELAEVKECLDIREREDREVSGE